MVGLLHSKEVCRVPRCFGRTLRPRCWVGCPKNYALFFCLKVRTEEDWPITEICMSLPRPTAERTPHALRLEPGGPQFIFDGFRHQRNFYFQHNKIYKASWAPSICPHLTFSFTSFQPLIELALICITFFSIHSFNLPLPNHPHFIYGTIFQPANFNASCFSPNPSSLPLALWSSGPPQHPSCSLAAITLQAWTAPTIKDKISPDLWSQWSSMEQ